MTEETCETKKTELVNVSEAAKVLGVHPDTVRRWADKGLLKCTRHPCNKYRVFYVVELEEFLGGIK